MNIEEIKDFVYEVRTFGITSNDAKFVQITEYLLSELEKEKEKNKSIDEFCRKELAFKRRLQRENRQPDEFNQGRFYVSENIRKIIREE